jgi:hypothetical protein
MNVNIVLQFYYKLVTFIDLGKNTCYNKIKKVKAVRGVRGKAFLKEVFPVTSCRFSSSKKETKMEVTVYNTKQS